jgi:cytochrome c-type biogenesis protein CcmH
MMCSAFGAMPWLFHRIVRLIKVNLSFMPTKPIRLAVGLSVFLTAMILASITTTVLTVGTIPALAVTPEEILGDPKLEARARALSKQLRCLVCQNQSIDDSDADLARDLRVEVRRQITAGRSDEIIIDQIRQKYGDYVLFNPPLDRGTVFLWLAPIGFVGLAVLIIVLARRNLHTLASPELGASDRARIEAMLVTRNSANSNEKGGHEE